jgi:hypothetical protein
MGSINEVVKVTVTAETGALAREGFGTPCVMYYHTRSLARMLSVTSSKGLEDLGFTRSADAALFVAADTIFAQDPKPAKLKVGRLTVTPAQTLTITVTSAVEGDKHTLKVNDYEVVRVIPAASTPALEAAAIQALIAANVPTAGATVVGAVITITSTGNNVTRIRQWSRGLSLKSTGTAHANLAADLSAIMAEDSDFTGFDLVSMNEAESKVAALFAENNGKLFFPTFYDTEIKDSLVTTDAISDLKALLYKNTHCGYSQKDTHSYWGIALFARLGAQFAPGGETFAHKQVVGVLADDTTTMNSGELDTVRGKNGNVYYPVFKKAITWEGVRCDGGWIDERRFLLWQAYDAAISLFEAISNQPGKLPYDSTGRNVLMTALEVSMGRGVASGGWTEDVPIQIIAPTVEEVKRDNASLVAGRRFPTITGRATLAGAIHGAEIQVTALL